MSRAKVAEIVHRLREAAYLQDPIAKAAIEMIRLSAEVTRESLVAADGNDMLRLQGAVRQLDKLHKDLITKPPQTKSPEAQA